nr:SDR family NAD(P)-dependent oxidoreductase [Anaerolineae bacterium]
MFNPYADLTDKVAIVTGGAQGIGRAICQRLAEVGMQVVVADIAIDKGERTRDEMIAAGGRAEF